jgi:hypothetical protein
VSAEQTAYLATCGLMFAAGVVILLIGAALSHIVDEYADWPGIVMGLGLLCMVVGPIMLIGFPGGAT